MGADGHIDVFDWGKIKNEFGDEAEILLKTANAYIDKMKTPNGEEFEVYHGYYDYNYHCDYNDYDSYFEDGDREIFDKVLTWSLKNAKLFSWEVWT